MKIKKRTLLRLIENYLFEDNNDGLENSQNYTGGKGMKGEPLLTKDVKFKWGSYEGKHADEKYVILQGEKDLGDYQKRGDPFTYKELENGDLKIISGPAKFDSSIGKITSKKKTSISTGESGGESGSKKGTETMTTISGLELGFDEEVVDEFENAITLRNNSIGGLYGIRGNLPAFQPAPYTDDSGNRITPEKIPAGPVTEDYIKEHTGETGSPPRSMPPALSNLTNGRNAIIYNKHYKILQRASLKLLKNYLNNLRSFWEDIYDTKVATSNNISGLADMGIKLTARLEQYYKDDACFGYEENVGIFVTDAWWVIYNKSGERERDLNIYEQVIGPTLELMKSLKEVRDNKDLQSRIEKLVVALKEKEKEYN